MRSYYDCLCHTYNNPLDLRFNCIECILQVDDVYAARGPCGGGDDSSGRQGKQVPRHPLGHLQPGL